MEPIDYEKFFISNRLEIEKDPIKHILYFPIDDVEIVEINKKFSTVEQPKPELEYIFNKNIDDLFIKMNFLVRTSTRW
jgi:hypothetical protein